MNHYEITFIVSPDMPEADAQKVESKIHSSIAKKGGSVISNDFWGKHEFAYPIRKHSAGYYTTAVFNLPPEHTSELVTEIRLMPEILRHLLISLEKEKVKVEDLKKMDLFREQPAPVAATTRRAPASVRPSAVPTPPPRQRKDEATRMKELEEKLEDILSEEKDET